MPLDSTELGASLGIDDISSVPTVARWQSDCGSSKDPASFPFAISPSPPSNSPPSHRAPFQFPSPPSVFSHLLRIYASMDDLSLFQRQFPEDKDPGTPLTTTHLGDFCTAACLSPMDSAC